MKLKDLKILIVGSGSIGQRHLRNVWNLGYRDVAICDPSADRLQMITTEFDVASFSSYDQALADFCPDAVLICTPPILHVPQALKAIEHNAHVFIEKPLSNTLQDVDQLMHLSQSRERVVQIGYNLRFHPGLLKIKSMLDEKVIGRLLWAHIEVGHYLPNWRPWQDYRQGYTARKDLGGGIILDASHEINYALWFFGQPEALVCMSGHVSSLEVDVEDCATIIFRCKGGMQVDIHLDFVQLKRTRSCKIAGENGVIEWSMLDNSIEVSQPECSTRITHEFEINQMYIDEIEYFLDTIDRLSISTDSLTDAKRTLEVALAAHKSNAEGRLITL